MKNLNQTEITKLELDFDEASELFSDETLGAMQMAQVNGGAAWGAIVKKIGEWAGAAAAAIGVEEIIRAVSEAITGRPNTTVSQQQLDSIVVTDSTITIGNMRGIDMDSIIVSNGQMTIKAYGIGGGTTPPSN